VAHKLAIASEKITADVIEVGEFPEVAQRYRVSGVPKIVINDTVEFVGAQPETRFVQEVLRAAAAKSGGAQG
jgi:predicted DsbA family dithiol-disulfide isomerase